MDATLIGIGGVWGSRVYLGILPPNLVAYFRLKCIAC